MNIVLVLLLLAMSPIAWGEDDLSWLEDRLDELESRSEQEVYEDRLRRQYHFNWCRYIGAPMAGIEIDPDYADRVTRIAVEHLKKQRYIAPEIESSLWNNYLPLFSPDEVRVITTRPGSEKGRSLYRELVNSCWIRLRWDYPPNWNADQPRR